MDNSIINLFVHIFLIALGLFSIIYHKRWGIEAAKFQLKYFHLHYKERGYQIGYLFIGIFFVVFGLLVLLGIIK